MHCFNIGRIWLKPTTSIMSFVDQRYLSPYKITAPGRNVGHWIKRVMPYVGRHKTLDSVIDIYCMCKVSKKLWNVKLKRGKNVTILTESANHWTNIVQSQKQTAAMRLVTKWIIKLLKTNSLYSEVHYSETSFFIHLCPALCFSRVLTNISTHVHKQPYVEVYEYMGWGPYKYLIRGVTEPVTHKSAANPSVTAPTVTTILKFGRCDLIKVANIACKINAVNNNAFCNGEIHLTKNWAKYKF